MLPYGLQKRVELGRALALEPDLLLLDEPLAGLNLEEVEDMARFILDINEEPRWKVTCILVEHDMGVVMDISHRVFVLNFGNKIMDGNPQGGPDESGGDQGLPGRGGSLCQPEIDRRGLLPDDQQGSHHPEALPQPVPEIRGQTKWP